MIGTQHFAGTLTGIDQTLLAQLLDHIFVNIQTVFLVNDFTIWLEFKSIQGTQNMFLAAGINSRDVGIFNAD